MDLPLPYTRPAAFNAGRLDWDIQKSRSGQETLHERYDAFWAKNPWRLLPPELFNRPEKIWLDLGAGSGGFFTELARLHPDRFLVAIERSKIRAQRLVRKVGRSAQSNLVGFRGNAIPALIHGVPTARLERIYLMYPCPWPKNAQRKNRWYLHPIMPHLLRTLEPGGLLIWTSDQKFYIDEARYVCEQVYGLDVLVHGAISPNAYNHLGEFQGGRTKFEQMFLSHGQPCYEVVVQKPSTNKSGSASTPGLLA